MSAFDSAVMNGVASVVSRPLRWIIRLFTAHPAEKGLTYFTHLRRAWWMAWRMGCGSFCLMVHGVLPWCYPTSGSHAIRQLYASLHAEEVKIKEEQKGEKMA